MRLNRLLVFLVIIIVLSIFSIYYPQIQKMTGQASKVNNEAYINETAVLLRVVDGDTIHALIDGKDETIRLLGINTPEKKMPYADYAKNFLKEFENKTIIMQRDIEDIDKYNRKLRYIFYNGMFLNLEILENGYANAYYTNGLLYEDMLLRAEGQARVVGVGVWQKSGEKCASCLNLKELNYTEEFFIIKNTCSFDCNMTKWFAKDAGRNVFWLSFIKSEEEQKIISKSEVWNNDGDKFFIFDDEGKLVLYYEY